MERLGDLEIEQDLPFQEREWRAERIGWAFLVLLVVLSVAGLFGNGPISWATGTTDDGLEVDYERFGRRGGSQELTVRAGAATADGGVWELEISRGYLASLEVTAVTPEPDSVETVEDAVRYTFEQGTPDAALEVIFAVTPRHLWSQRGRLGLASSDTVTISQFFFP